MNDKSERNMLVRFSVSTMGGLEIFSYEPDKYKEVTTDPALVSGFMSSTKRHEGTGLGLYLCKKLLELLHGDISVTSHFGEGSEFKFIIPLN